MIDFANIQTLYLGGNEVGELYIDGNKVWASGSTPVVQRYLTFENTDGNTCTVGMAEYGSPPSIGLEYSIDGTTWYTYSIGTGGTHLDFTLSSQGDKVMFRAQSGGNTQISSGSSNYHYFVTTGNLKVYGDITTLLDKSGNVTTMSSSQGDCFNSLFKGSTIVDAEGLVLPITTVNAAGVYSCMFLDCTSLVTPPAEIPDMAINGTYTFNQMFQGCTSLTSTPKVLVTTSNGKGYTFKDMFKGCTSLTDVDFDALVTASGDYCMSYTFSGCTSLATVEFPSLEYIGYGSYGWRYAFASCRYLTSAKFPKLREVINTNTMVYMFDGCSRLETVDMGEIQTIQSYQTLNYTWRFCTSLTEIDFSKATAVPNLSDVNAFNNTNTTFRIVVPDHLYDSWIQTKNWCDEWVSQHIVKASEYIGGMALRSTQDNSTVGMDSLNNVPQVSLEYTVDYGKTWNDFIVSRNGGGGTTITLDNGKYAFIRAKTNNTAFSDGSQGNTFVMTGQIEAWGNAMWLLDSTGQSTTMSNYGF